MLQRRRKRRSRRQEKVKTGQMYICDKENPDQNERREPREATAEKERECGRGQHGALRFRRAAETPDRLKGKEIAMCVCERVVRR